MQVAGVIDGFVSVGSGVGDGWSGVRLVLFSTCGCGESCLGVLWSCGYEVLCHDVSLGHGVVGLDGFCLWIRFWW